MYGACFTQAGEHSRRPINDSHWDDYYAFLTRLPSPRRRKPSILAPASHRDQDGLHPEPTCGPSDEDKGSLSSLLGSGESGGV